MKRLRYGLLAVGAMVLGGCTVRMVDFTMISTKNVKTPPQTKGNRVSGETCVFNWFGAVPDLKSAIDRAIESAGPEYDALVDGVVYETGGLFQTCFKVEGTPINTKAGLSMSHGEGHLFVHSSNPRPEIATP